MNNKTTRSLLLGLILGAPVSLYAQSPKIVVGIMVDQLRTDYLEQLRPYFGANGFNRLIRDGLYITDLDFRGTVDDATAATAVVYTGAWPSANGVSAQETLDRKQHRSIPVLSNPDKLKTEYSPENLRLSTIADELAINIGSLSKIYSVAGDPQVAVISAGHAGNAAIWLDESTGKWTSPVFYGSMPPSVSNRNHTASLTSRMGSSSWKPSPALSSLPALAGNRGADFSYSFIGGGKDGYARFKAAAPFNEEVTDVAIEVLKSMRNNGSSGQPGMVNVAYSLAPYKYDFDGDNRPELFDSYLKLDSELGKLLDSIDRDFGRGNAVIFLSSTGYADEPSIPDSGFNIPTGEISLKKAESLLNAFLSASYGNGDYVTVINDGKLYLDAREAERKGIEIEKIRSAAKMFLLKMGGVSEAYTIDEVLFSGSDRAGNLALRVDQKNIPDLFIFFTPGWSVTDDNSFPEITETVRLGTPLTPAFILAPGVESETISYSVDATVLAPTISAILRIRSPNGASSKPLNLNSIH